ncbi:hypothetical protein Pelo_18529 [Pelomyxa schiedti]|nr:hypothetical protein Pelo_18529 [Pelomyxa schiedti]
MNVSPSATLSPRTNAVPPPPPPAPPPSTGSWQPAPPPAPTTANDTTVTPHGTTTLCSPGVSRQTDTWWEMRTDAGSLNGPTPPGDDAATRTRCVTEQPGEGLKTH